MSRNPELCKFSWLYGVGCIAACVHTGGAWRYSYPKYIAVCVLLIMVPRGYILLSSIHSCGPGWSRDVENYRGGIHQQKTRARCSRFHEIQQDIRPRYLRDWSGGY